MEWWLSEPHKGKKFKILLVMYLFLQINEDGKVLESIPAKSQDEAFGLLVDSVEHFKEQLEGEVKKEPFYAWDSAGEMDTSIEYTEDGCTWSMYWRILAIGE